MISTVLENGLDAELEEELGYSKYDYRNKDTDNARNGYSKKNIKTSYGELEVKIPRDRQGEFDPQLIKKQQNTLSQDIEENIISMYAKGMTTKDIADLKLVYTATTDEKALFEFENFGNKWDKKYPKISNS